MLNRKYQERRGVLLYVVILAILKISDFYKNNVRDIKVLLTGYLELSLETDPDQDRLYFWLCSLR